MSLAGKRVKIFYKDGTSVRCREGIVVSEDVGFIVLKNEFGQDAYPTINVVRVEVF